MMILEEDKIIQVEDHRDVQNSLRRISDRRPAVAIVFQRESDADNSCSHRICDRFRERFGDEARIVTKTKPMMISRWIYRRIIGYDKSDSLLYADYGACASDACYNYSRQCNGVCEKPSWMRKSLLAWHESRLKGMAPYPYEGGVSELRRSATETGNQG